MPSRQYGESEVTEAVLQSRSLSEALRLLGLRPAGGNHATLKRLIERWGIATDHFDPYWRARRGGHNRLTPLEDILVQGSTYSRGHLKKRLLDSGLKRTVCEMCAQGEMWRGHEMALILDHINGDPTDNRLENLRILCPNCAATLDTHCGRKNRTRPCAHCGVVFQPQMSRQRYCSRACGAQYPRKPRPHTRKVSRPPLDILQADIQRLGYLGTGRKYGVSDNAIRKWVKWLENEPVANPTSTIPS